MKNFLSVLFTFFSISLFAQTNVLSKLSNGKYLDSSVIYDNETEDVFGYVLLYEIDKKAKDVFELEYVFLDNNLNKISSKSLDQQRFSSFYKTMFNMVKKNGDEVIVGIYEINTNPDYFGHPPLNSRYISFNTKTLVFSDSYYFEKNQKNKFEIQNDLKLKYSELQFRQEIKRTQGNYYVQFNVRDEKISFGVVNTINSIKGNRSKAVNGFSVLDKNYNKVWTYNFNQDVENSYDEYQLLTSSNETFVMLKTIHSKNLIKTLEVFSVKDGKNLASIPYGDFQYSTKLHSIETNGNNYDIIYALYQVKEKDFLSQSILGYSKLSIDKKTGQQVGQNYLTWTDLKSHFNFKKPEKSGEIAKYGNLLLRDFISLKSGNHIGVFEGTLIKKNNHVFKDYHFVEFDKNLNVLKITKQANSENMDYKFDRFKTYRFSQKLNSNDEFVFFYETIEKENKKNVHKLVITTYLNNQFSQEKLQLSDKDSKIYPSLAKNGYILLLEHDKKGNAVEQRLEKINL